jgi:Fic family protein
MHVEPPPPLSKLMAGASPEALVAVLDGTLNGILPQGGYLHWDKLRHLAPPPGLSHEDWWLRLKLARRPALRELPLADPQGKPFVYAVPDEVFRLLHFVDQRCSGEIAMEEVVTADGQARQHYLVNSLMEEAIRSSQLEGATTSRRVAKELLRSGREPSNRSERMIANNYRALQFMRDDLGDHLTPEKVLELQGILTEGTLDDPGTAGRLQRSDEERIAVYDRATGELVHRPPPADQLPERLVKLCAFANQPDDADRFIHPAVRGILLHFWLAYDHPFEDGNGRTARALFYWYMRARGYWLVEYLSISRILRKAPAKYGRAFLLTETDDRDTTYFLLYQLEVLHKAVGELHEYLRKKISEVQAVERLIRGSTHFNHRQLALLSDAVRNPANRYTFRSHAASHNTTHETARTDLIQLFERGLLKRERVGRRHVFAARDGLSERLALL